MTTTIITVYFVDVQVLIQYFDQIICPAIINVSLGQLSFLQ